MWQISSGRKRESSVEVFVGGAADPGVGGGINDRVGKVMWDY